MFTEKDIVKYKELISQGKNPEEAKNIMKAEQNKIFSTEQSFQTPNYLSSIQKKPIIDEKIQYNKRYFSDEKKIVDEMLKEGYSEDISRQTIEKRRKEILPLGKLKTDEATFLIKMADAGITSEQAVQGLNEYRNEEKKKQWDNMNIAQKAGKTYFDFVLGTLGGGVGEVGGIVDFATRGNSELGKMGMEGRTVAREINKGSIAGTTGDILGSGIIDYGLGKTLGTVGGIGNKFNKLKPVNQIIGGGAGFGALTAIGEKGSKATAEDITTSASIGAGAGLVLGKVIVPAASKVAQKGIKYGTALQKGGTEGLTKSISRDLKKPVGIFKKSIQGTADNLSTNINRMTKGEIQKFKKSHKVSVGKFLNDRGISESGDDLLEKLSENLKLSRKEANKGLEKIKGNFKAPKQQIATDIIDETTGKYKVIESDPVETMLKDNLINSSNKGLSKDSLRAKELLEKYQKDGLSMPEINEGKRWFEANNKFSYLTDDTSSRKGFVTGLDNAVREWQFDTAIKNGFGNLREINKQTKAYYELLEGITKWNEGSKGNLPIGLTDWLAFNADPAVFLAKQITQSGKVKKGVIKFLNLGRKTQPEVTPALFSKKVKNVNNIRNSTNSPALESIQGGNLKPNQPTNVSNKPIKKASETGRKVLKKPVENLQKNDKSDIIKPLSDNKTKMSEPIIKKRRELTKEQINQLKEKLKPAVDKTKEDLIKAQKKVDSKKIINEINLEDNQYLSDRASSYFDKTKDEIYQKYKGQDIDINDTKEFHNMWDEYKKMLDKGKYQETNKITYEGKSITVGDEVYYNTIYGKYPVKVNKIEGGPDGKYILYVSPSDKLSKELGGVFPAVKKDFQINRQYTLLDKVETSKSGRKLLNTILPSNFKEKAQDFIEGVADKVGARTKLLGGEGAKQMPTNLEKAKNWEKSGKSADDIWKETGWEKGTDGKWKFEIDDSKAKLLKTEGEGKLSDFLEHKELFKQYPELSNRKITFKDLGGDMGGKIEGNNIFINNTNIFTKEEMRATLLHELQHNIQKQEGFARGGVPKISNKLQEAQKEFDEVLSKMKTLKEQGKQTEYLKLRKDKYYQYGDKVAKLKRIADNKYKKLSGEVEARNIQARLLNKDNKIRRPELTEDVARDKQIIKMDGGKAMSVSDDLIENVGKYTEGFKEGKLFDISPQSKSKISSMEIKADMGEITQKDIDGLNKWFKENKDNYIKLYHGTSPQWNILDEGLKATSRKTAKSLQSGWGYVYLSFDPSRAKTFGEMAYAGKTPKVYEVKVKIGDLLADTDQIWNKRYWGENQNIGDTLADSLLYGKGFKVKGNVEPYKISEYQANKPKPLAKKDGGKAMSVSDDLISEARKYKSAESFGNKLFDDNKLVSHGTNGDFKLSDYKTNTLGYYGKGFYVGTESKARGYGKNLKSFEFKKTPKFFTDFNSKSDLENIALKFMSKDTNIDYATRYLNAWENFQKNLQKKGYDGIDSGFDEKLIFNPEKILKEVDYNAKQIYEQANKPKLLRPAKTEDVANKNKLLQK